MYQQGYDEGVTYFESRKNFGLAERLYHLDPDSKYKSTNGEVFHGVNWQASAYARHLFSCIFSFIKII